MNGIIASSRPIPVVVGVVAVIPWFCIGIGLPVPVAPLLLHTLWIHHLYSSLLLCCIDKQKWTS
jgi:hypothetical protein